MDEEEELIKAINKNLELMKECKEILEDIREITDALKLKEGDK